MSENYSRAGGDYHNCRAPCRPRRASRARRGCHVSRHSASASSRWRVVPTPVDVCKPRQAFLCSGQRCARHSVLQRACVCNDRNARRNDTHTCERHRRGPPRCGCPSHGASRPNATPRCRVATLSNGSLHRMREVQALIIRPSWRKRSRVGARDRERERGKETRVAVGDRSAGASLRRPPAVFSRTGGIPACGRASSHGRSSLGSGGVPRCSPRTVWSRQQLTCGLRQVRAETMRWRA